ncbi:hypothetical protein F5Y03DRAFT_408111 [Xylaria venustula]|nr:hypothetical protein F5Y03DRAFT_408111 [Xylaria venustula]
MHQQPITRRMVLTATVIFVLLALFTYQYLLISRNKQAVPLAVTVSTACNIWSDIPTRLDLQQYENCHSITTTTYVGDTAVLGNPQHCLRASVRLDQYRPSTGRNWTNVRWGQVQTQCASGEAKTLFDEELMRNRWRSFSAPELHYRNESRTTGENVAIVLRTWDDYEYSENRLAWLRALIAEASLQRKANYRVFFLVDVKDPEARLEEDDIGYDQMMRKCVPSEFRDIAFLFNENTLKTWYPAIQEHGAKDQMYQALQIFSHKFPEYDYIWQLEMDLRFTSHVYDTLQSATSFAQAQRRRNLWERNGRFYIPAFHNNSYENMSQVVDAEIGDRGIWGPVSTRDFEPQGPPAPPRSEIDWGIGEEADLINFMPMIDPIGTGWIYEYDFSGFSDYQATPRRSSIISITRSSRRLLQLIHEAQQKRGQWLVSEATLETFALLHGLKAVTVPHPIAFGGRMNTEDLDANIHKGPSSNKAGGELPSMLYTYEGWIQGPWVDSSYWFVGYGAQRVWEAYIKGAHFPPMLLHPVKEK